MQQLILFIHVIVSIVLVILILLQQGKGADAGIGIGSSGNAQSVFGSQGASGVLVRLTSIFAVIFFATSVFLGYIAVQQSKVVSEVEQTVLPPGGS